MAHIVRFYQTGGPEVLKIEQSHVPPPGPGEVRIAVKALGLNRAEAMFRSGQYLEQPKFPARLGYEAAGTVEAIGEGVQGLKVGDAVSTIPAFSQNKHGVYGDSATVPAFAVAKHPTTLSWVDAAAIWMQYATAYGALIEIAGLKTGDTILIPAASSSVGIAAIQIANLVGATPIALTRRSSKRQPLLDIGAAHVIATEEQDLAAETMKLTRGKGARIVFDPVGGPTIAKLTTAMAEHGTLILYGALSTEPTPLPLMDALIKSLTIRGYVLFEITGDPKRLESAKRFIVEGLAAGTLKPIVAKTFPLEQVVEARSLKPTAIWNRTSKSARSWLRSRRRKLQSRRVSGPTS
jgi:NADPH:quinone reductase-like Zn-dependent oxidoreductase